MTRLRKEQLKEHIDKLEPQEHAQIFTIIKRYTEHYTKTEHGVLISSDVLSNECLLEVEKLVAFYVDQRKLMSLERR